VHGKDASIKLPVTFTSIFVKKVFGKVFGGIRVRLLYSSYASIVIHRHLFLQVRTLMCLRQKLIVTISPNLRRMTIRVTVCLCFSVLYCLCLVLEEDGELAVYIYIQCKFFVGDSLHIFAHSGQRSRSQYVLTRAVP